MKRSGKVAWLLNAGRKNLTVIILIAAFFLGIIAGSLLNYNVDESDRGLLIQFAGNILTMQSTDQTVVNALSIHFAYFFLIMLSGLAAPGFLVVASLPFIKGFSFGYTAAFIFSVFGVKGLWVCALGILPQTFISSLAIILACGLAVNYSLAIARCLNGAPMRKFSFHRYIFFIGAMFLVSVATIVFDIFVTPAILNIFTG